jgi:ABC-2 type transport system ATP-binding protein
MEEASRMAERIAIIDHGKIIESGSPEEITKKTDTSSLEDAFIKITGHEIRDEGANNLDALRQGARIWGGRR